MTKVLTPLTTPPMKPLPELSSPEPQSWARSMAFLESSPQLMSSSAMMASNWGRYSSNSSSCSWRRFAAWGI